MKYVKIEVTCVACLKEVEKPSDCIMDSFRLGIPLHIECGKIVDRFLLSWKKAFGVAYYVNWDELQSIEAPDGERFAEDDVV